MQSSCRALALPPALVLKEVKEQRLNAFKGKTAGFETGMRTCPNCNQLGLFVHDGDKAKCVHPDHQQICEAKHQKEKEEKAEADRLATAPRKTGCLTCGCWAMIRPNEFKPAEGEDAGPHRCARHICLSAAKLEIACGGKCDGCMQVQCRRCDRCKCYKSSYSIRRCPDCTKLNHDNPNMFPLAPAFPPRTTQLTICNICHVLQTQRANAAERKRRAERNSSAYYSMGFGDRRQEERIARHLRKWKAECIRDKLAPNSKDASRRLAWYVCQSRSHIKIHSFKHNYYTLVSNLMLASTETCRHGNT